MGSFNDFGHVRRLVLNEVTDGYSYIYQKCNEDLGVLFDKVSVKDKDVLSVVGSGDQVFSSIYNGCNSIEMFDINILAKHHFYLRKWAIELLGEKYLNSFSKFKSNDEFIDFLKRVIPSDKEEADSLSFWFYCGIYINLNLLKNIFYKSVDTDTSSFDHNRIVIPNVKFHNVDITGDIDIIDKKFDVIIMSNILEYCEGIKNLSVVRSNLYKLLNENGIVLCSHVMRSSYDIYFEQEKEFFSRFFDCYEYSGKSKKFDAYMDLGYSYKKKR